MTLCTSPCNLTRFVRFLFVPIEHRWAMDSACSTFWVKQSFSCCVRSSTPHPLPQSGECVKRECRGEWWNSWSTTLCRLDQAQRVRESHAAPTRCSPRTAAAPKTLVSAQAVILRVGMCVGWAEAEQLRMRASPLISNLILVKSRRNLSHG